MSKITLILGKRGKGKSLTAVKIAVKKYTKKNKAVFSTSTLPIKDGYKLSTEFYKYKFPRGSLLIIDEGQIDFDSRSYKNTDLRLRRFIAYIRHYGLDMIVITQYSDGIEKLFKCGADVILDLRKLFRFPFFKLSIYREYEDLVEYQKYLDGKDCFSNKLKLRILSNKYFKYYDSYILDPEYENSIDHPIKKYTLIGCESKFEKIRKFLTKDIKNSFCESFRKTKKHKNLFKK